MKQFFKKYPKAPGLWKVGDRFFLHTFKAQAQDYATRTGQQLEEVTKGGKVQPKENQTDGS